MLKWIFLILFAGCNKNIVHPIKGEIVEAVYGLGTVQSEHVFRATSAIISYVEEFYVTEGQDVIKGQKLFKTDQGSIISAPFDGRVTDIPVSIRENLFPQTIILTIVNLKKIYLAVSLEQQGAMRIKPGLDAEISFEFFRNIKLKGKIKTIYPSKEQFIAKVELNDWPEGVMPGMTADVAFEINRKKNATLVPINSIVNGSLIFKRNGKKIKSPVELGLVDLEKAEVLKPELDPKDELVIP